MKENVLKIRTKMFLILEHMIQKHEQPILLGKILYLKLIVFNDHYYIKLTLCKVQISFQSNHQSMPNGQTQPVVAIKLR